MRHREVREDMPAQPRYPQMHEAHLLSRTGSTACHTLRDQNILPVDRWGDTNHVAKCLDELNFGFEAGVSIYLREGYGLLFQQV
jgi:hypothetical protein